MSFWSEALPYAEQAHAETGVLTSVILAQWADETGYRWPPPDNNPGNVGTFGGHTTSYATVQAGVDGYILTMNLPYYTGVRSSVGWMAQCHALGESPWAGSHYEASGPPPGEDLVKIIEANNLTQYDSQPAPGPPAEPPEDAEMCYDPDRKQIHAVAVVNGVPYHWWQPTVGQNPFPPGTTWGVEELKT